MVKLAPLLLDLGIFSSSPAIHAIVVPLNAIPAANTIVDVCFDAIKALKWYEHQEESQSNRDHHVLDFQGNDTLSNLCWMRFVESK